MIRFKKLEVPDVGEKILRVTPAYLKKSERVFSCVPIGLSEEAGRFVVAEGSEDIGAIEENTQELFATRGELFWRTNENNYTRLSDGRSFIGNLLMKQLVSYPGITGITETLFIGPNGLFQVSGTQTKRISAAVVGTCLAVHHERAFVGNENKLSYSAPLDVEDWTSETAGSVDLPTTGGEILALLSFKERLYVFRKGEILRVRADANDLNFKFEQVEVDYGEFLRGSLQPCGEKFVFATPRGLVVGDGVSFRYVPMTRFSAAFSDTVQSGHTDGKYYASVSHNDGTRSILVYDPETDGHHFLGAEAELLSGVGEGIYYKRGSRLYRLNRRGFLADEVAKSHLEISLEIGDAKGETRRIDAVSIAGKGTFAIMLKTENGMSTVRLQEGKKTYLPRVLRGAFLDLCVHALEESCSLAALNLHFREETP